MSWRVMDAGHYPFGFVDPPEHLTVENDTTYETVRYVPERTCKMEHSTLQKEGYPSLTTYTCSVCGMGYLSIEAPERGDYCKGCGAKVVGL